MHTLTEPPRTLRGVVTTSPGSTLDVRRRRRYVDIYMDLGNRLDKWLYTWEGQSRDQISDLVLADMQRWGHIATLIAAHAHGRMRDVGHRTGLWGLPGVEVWHVECLATDDRAVIAALLGIEQGMYAAARKYLAEPCTGRGCAVHTSVDRLWGRAEYLAALETITPPAGSRHLEAMPVFVDPVDDLAWK